MLAAAEQSATALKPGGLWQARQMQIVLVRHGQPEWTLDGLGVINPPLTRTGARQAQLTADRLAAEVADGRSKPFDEVLVSPIVRAQQTAAPICAALDTTPTTAEWLAEIRNPDAWDGTPAEEIEEVFATARHRHLDDLWDGLPGGESFRAFHRRVTSGLRRWLVAQGATPAAPFPALWNLPATDRRVLIVAHAGTNAVILTGLLGIEPVPWEWERFVTFHASVTELRPTALGGAHAFSLYRLSDLSHLPTDFQTY